LTVNALLFFNAKSIDKDYPPKYWIVRFFCVAESTKKSLYYAAILMTAGIVAVNTLIIIDIIRGVH
jgi:hypothetical protein